MSASPRLRSMALSLLAACGLAGLEAPAADAGTPTVRLFPADAIPGGIAAGPDGAIWFTDQSSTSAVRRMDANGHVQTITNGISLGSTPRGITAGPDGNMWFTEKGTDRVAKLSLQTQSASEFGTGLTHGAVPTSITAGSDGNLWFVEADHSAVGRVTTAGTINEFPLAGTASDIAAGSDGSLWVSLSNSIVRIAPDGSVAGTFSSGISGSPGTITAGPDGNLWFTEDNGKIGRMTTAGAVTEFPLPGPGVSTVTGIIAGPDGNLWFGDFSSRNIGRITPAGVITEFATGLDPTEVPCDLTAGSDGAVWFMTCGNLANPHHIGRITTGVAPPRYTDPIALTVPATGTSGAASQYPATIDVDGLQGTVTKVTVRLNGIHHARASDLLVQLVGPQGENSLLMANATSRAGDAGTPGDVLNGDVVTFSSDGVDPLRRLTSGIVKPFDPGFLLNFTPPAPPNTPQPPANLGVFNGTAPNGAWKLFVFDDEAGNDFSGNPSVGAIAGGWSLDVQTSGPTVQVPGPTTTVTVPGPTITVPGPATAAQSDTSPPVLTLGKLPATLPLATLRKGLSVQVTSSEAATLEASLNVGVSKATLTSAARRAPSSSPLELDATTASAAAGEATKLQLRPSAKLLGKPKKAFTVELRLRATDAAGNRTTVSRRIRITLAKASKARR